MCSLAARGLWIEIIGYMHEAEPYGHFLIDGRRPTLSEIACLVGRPLREVENAFAELVNRRVCECVDGTLVSRRMVRDKAKHETDVANGKGGGNPKLNPPDNGGVNPPHKAHIPKPEPEKESELRSADPRRDLFDRGLKALARMTGKTPDSCRSLVGKWLKTVDDEAIQVLGAIEDAERNRIADPVAWINRALKPRGNSNGKPTIHDAARTLSDRIRALEEPAPSELCDGEGGSPLRLLSAR